MNLKVLNDRVLVKPDENEYVDPLVDRIVKEGTLIIPDIMEGAVKKVAAKGTIISFGNQCKYNFKIGDTIIYGRFSGCQYYFNDVKYLLLMEDEIHGIEEND